MKMVICDDEIPTLRLLEEILDWKSLGINSIFKAYNGREALSVIERQNPDILVTDIVMPVMDGLELISRVRKENQRMEIIILSAFNEFEYARKALGYGVRGYLLKPLDERKLESMIRESLGSISLGDSKDEAHRKSVDFATERLLRQLLYPRHNLGDYRKIMNMLEISINLDIFTLALISITRLDYNNYIQATERYKPERLFSQLSDYFTKYHSGRIFFFENTPDEHVIIIDETRESLSGEIVSACLDYLSGDTKIMPVIALSRQYSSYINIHSAYEEASGYLSMKHLFENQKILRPQMFSGNIPDATGSDVRRGSLQQNITLQTENWKQESWPESSAALTDCKAIHTGDRSRYIKKAKQYISDHYSENIVLDDICSHAGISKNYFCHLFRTETGLSIWEFLTEFRIEKARQLLAGSDMKNYEIAFHIGYENPSYFSRIFRKLTGKSPTDFRNEIAKI